MIAKFHGKSYTLQSIRSKSFITKSGVSMLGISDAAENIGFRTRGYRLTWEQLRDEVPLPCTVHWNQKHFVMAYKVKKRKVWGWEKKEKSRASHASRASQKPDLQDLQNLQDLQFPAELDFVSISQ
jgi:ABC-type bacteriocin/lantibiotic exporter with double-glycine peptidase domain